jgi:cytosine/adenosine deaminase-related metal-dependent hydrolase
MTGLNRREFIGLSAAATGWGGAASAAEIRAAAPPALARSPVKTLIRGANLLTLSDKQGEIPASDVLIDGGKIVAIGKGLSTEGAYVVDARGMVLMPGMVDGYRHVWQALHIGELVHTEPARFSEYPTFKNRLMVCLKPEDQHLAGYLGGLQAIDAGVTTLLDYADIQYTTELAIAAASGLRDSGINGWFAYQISRSPSDRAGSAVARAPAGAQRDPAEDTHFETVAELRRQVFSSESAASLRLGICMSPDLLGTPMPAVQEQLVRIRALQIGLIAAPLSRPAEPLPAGHFGSMDSGIQDLAAAGLLGPDLHFVHGNDLTSEELQYLQANGSSVCSAVLEEFVYKMNGQRGSVHGRARAAGVAAGIGTGSILAVTLDFLEHVRAAFWNLQLDADSEQISNSYTSDDTLQYATHLGAKALRLETVTGTIAIGKRADLTLLRTDRFGFGTLGSLADRVVSFACRRDVDSVWVNGRLRKSGGRLVGVDIRALSAQVRAVQARLEEAAHTKELVR